MFDEKFSIIGFMCIKINDSTDKMFEIMKSHYPNLIIKEINESQLRTLLLGSFGVVDVQEEEEESSDNDDANNRIGIPIAPFGFQVD